MMKTIAEQALKAARRMAREEEIRTYDHPICWSRIVQSDKVYSRKLKHRNLAYE